LFLNFKALSNNLLTAKLESSEFLIIHEYSRHFFSDRSLKRHVLSDEDECLACPTNDDIRTRRNNEDNDARWLVVEKERNYARAEAIIFVVLADVVDRQGFRAVRAIRPEWFCIETIREELHRRASINWCTRAVCRDRSRQGQAA